MRTFSPNTRRLVNQLYEPVSLWERLSHSGKAAGILTEIANSAELVAILDILPFVLADRKEVANAAAAAVRKLTEAASPTDLLGLDRLSRERSPYVGNYRLDWDRLLPKDLDRLQIFGEALAALLGIASFHHSGYVREEAVKRLNRITTGIEIPFLLIRLDDWVSCVRDDAQKAINRFMPVRREALRICVKHHPDKKRAELRSALLDAHPSIREEARYHLSQFDSLDVASFYRHGLTSGDERSLPSTISGLGETGVAEDGDLLVPYASHNAAKIRRAAIKALARLNSGALDVFILALMDQFPSVSRGAVKGLADKATLIGKGRLWEIFSSTSYSHVKRNALSLLEKIGKWDSIYFLVKSTSESDQSVASRALIAIDRWLWRFNRTFPVPTPNQLTKLNSAVKEWGDHLDEKTREQLWFCMKGF